METITTAGSGNWNSTTNNAPWPGGTVPDFVNHNVVIAAGHTVTVTTNCTLPETIVQSFDTGNSGGLVIADDVTVTLGGTLTLGNGSSKDGMLTLGAGSKILMSGHNIVNNNCKWRTSATSSKWAKIISGGGNIVNGAALSYSKQDIVLSYVSFQGTTGVQANSCAVDTNDVVTCNGHGLLDTDKIMFFATSMPTGLAANTTYYVRDRTDNTFKVSLTSGGTAVDISSTGTSVKWARVVTCNVTLSKQATTNDAVFTIDTLSTPVSPANNTPLRIIASSMPTGFSVDTIYYTVASYLTTFEVSESVGGASIDYTDAGTSVKVEYVPTQFGVTFGFANYSSGGSTNLTPQYNCPHCVYDVWHQIYLGKGGTAGPQLITNHSDFRSVNYLILNGLNSNAGDTSLQDCTFVGDDSVKTCPIIVYSRAYVNFSRSIFMGLMPNGVATAGGHIYDSCLVYTNSETANPMVLIPNGYTAPVTVQNCFFWCANSNPHVISNGGKDHKISIINNIFDTNESANNVITGGGGVPNMDLFNNLLIRGGNLYTCLTSDSSSSLGKTVTIDHNTLVTKYANTVHQGVFLCETNGKFAGTMEIKNNLLVGPDGSYADYARGFIACTGVGTSAVIDSIHHNAWWHYKQYELNVGAPGPIPECDVANTLSYLSASNNYPDTYPDFYEPSRSLEMWGRNSVDGPDLGSSATALDAVNYLLGLNGYSDVSKTQSAIPTGVAVSDVVAWVKAGFVPQNSVLSAAANDGLAIGAQPVVVSHVPTVTSITPQPPIATNKDVGIRLTGNNLYSGLQVSYDLGTVTYISADGSTLIVTLHADAAGTGTLTINNGYSTGTVTIESTTPTYAVTFVTSGGTSIPSQDVAAGAKATKPSTSPTKTGYSFDTWGIDSGGAVAPYDFNTIVTTDLTLFAIWIQNQFCTVTYNGNGSTAGTVPVDLIDYNPGAVVTVLGNTGSLVKTGYAFGRWNTAANGSGTNYDPNDAFYIGAVNVTLYAIWEAWAASYTVTYHGNGNTTGTAPVDARSYITGDTVVIESAGTLGKTGYVFNGWNTAANGSGTNYAANSLMTMTTANVNLYAVWSLVSTSDVAATVQAIFNTPLPEEYAPYAPTGATTPTLAQLLMTLMQCMTEKSVSGDPPVMEVKNTKGAPIMRLQLDSTNPTRVTRIE